MRAPSAVMICTNRDVLGESTASAVALLPSPGSDRFEREVRSVAMRDKGQALRPAWPRRRTMHRLGGDEAAALSLGGRRCWGHPLRLDESTTNRGDRSQRSRAGYGRSRPAGAPRSPARLRGHATLSYARRQWLVEAFRRGRRQTTAMSPRAPARRPQPSSRPLLGEQQFGHGASSGSLNDPDYPRRADSRPTSLARRRRASASEMERRSKRIRRRCRACLKAARRFAARCGCVSLRYSATCDLSVRRRRNSLRRAAFRMSLRGAAYAPRPYSVLHGSI
jgi:hypothetical protein